MRWSLDSTITDQLPLPMRAWVAYVRLGPKRGTGGTVGGNRLFRLAAWLTHIVASREDRFLTLRHRSAKFSISVDVGDFEIFNHTIDLWLYGSSESRLLTQLMHPGDVFLDIGANYGVYSLLAAYLGGSTSTVYAFEPQDRVAAALAASLPANGLTNVSVVNAVVASKVGVTEFFAPTSGSGVGSVFQSHAEQHSAARMIRVPSTTLDEFAKSQSLTRVDLVKIDVEGAEFEVLSGAQLVLSKFRPFVWFEVNPSSLAAAGSSQDVLLSTLRACGYTKFYDVAALDNRCQSASEVRGTYERLTNIVAVSPDRQSFFDDIFFRSVGSS